MFAFIVALLVSVVTTTVVLHYNHVHARWSADQISGVQKFHGASIPRIGGVGIFVALLWVAIVQAVIGDRFAQPFMIMLLCATPAFFGGLAEDLTKRVGVLARLLLTMFAAVLGFFLLDARLYRVDVAWIDAWLGWWWPIGLFLTAIAVGGVANAINIIDGYNGLAGVVSCVILAGLGYIAFQLGDILIFRACLAMIGAIVGFLLWNWPWGRIFLGDGGAYLVGFWIGELSLLLLARNPEVSPWFPLLLVAYPVVETLFSIYRRVVVRRGHPGLPDAVHLHQLIFRRLVRWSVGSEHARHLTARNSMTAPYLWLISSLSVFPAVLLWRYTWSLQIVFTCFTMLYVWFYATLVRFKAMKWWITRRMH